MIIKKIYQFRITLSLAAISDNPNNIIIKLKPTLPHSIQITSSENNLIWF